MKVAPEAAGFWRRLAAIVYDGLLLFAVLFLAAALVLLINRGEPVQSGNVVFQIYLVGVAFLFYGWFWTHGGQTLGMRAWHIKIQSVDGHPISWRQALVRFLVSAFSWACVGVGFLWIVFDPQHRAWHDLLSRSVVVKVPKR